MAKNAQYEDEEQEEVGDGDEGEEESSDYDDDAEDEEVLQQEPRPNAVYNSAALHDKLEEIGWPEGLNWMHTLCVDYHVDEEIDVEDDLAREMAFYTQALEGTRETFATLLQAGTPFLRPTDYYAEMVKSDLHMLKVKDKLLSQQKQMEEAEERRKARESKRFSKEVQAQKLKQRAQEKKQNIESVKKWRKMRQDQGFDGGEDEFAVDFDDSGGAHGSKKRNREVSKKFKGSGGRADDKFPMDFDNDNDNDDGVSKKRRRHDAPTGSFKKFKGSGGNAAFANPAQGKFNSFAGKGMGGKKPSFGSSQKGSRSAFGNTEKGSRSPGLHKKNPNAGSGSGLHRSPNAAPWDRSGGKGSGGKAGKGKSFQKRQSRDAKYGHGGRKSFKKANTADSSAGFFGSKRKKGKF